MSYNSKIILCKGIKLDKDYVNVLSYSENQMLALCNDNSHKIAEASNYTFIDRNRKIRVAFPYSQCVQANYIAFQNPDYSNKWFFAFIENVEFKGNNNTEITFKIDAWSTWFDKWTKKPCYIIREHVNDDTIGLHTVQENLDVGRVFVSDTQEDISLSQYGWICVSTSYDAGTGKKHAGITVDENLLHGNNFFYFEFNEYGILDFVKFLGATNKASQIDAIENIFYVPSALVPRAQLIQHSGTYEESGTTYNYNYYTLPNSFEVKSINQNFNKNYSFTGFTPKNNKCFCYPYNYLLVTNNIGNQNIYKYEDFSTNNCRFKIELATTVGISGKLIPLNYKGIDRDDDESIPLGKYPTFSWTSDAYTNWLTQQAVNMPTQIIGSAINSLGQFASGNVVGGLTNLANTMANTIGQFYSASLLPNTTNGQNTGDVNFAGARNTFTFKAMRCRNEYMQIIDDYFSRFGYKISRVKEPNITGRTYWNYIEIGTGECIGNGDAPANFMEEINNACRRGTTIWHSHDNIGNYNLSNSII